MSCLPLHTVLRTEVWPSLTSEQPSASLARWPEISSRGGPDPGGPRLTLCENLRGRGAVMARGERGRGRLRRSCDIVTVSKGGIKILT